MYYMDSINYCVAEIRWTKERHATAAAAATAGDDEEEPDDGCFELNRTLRLLWNVFLSRIVALTCILIAIQLGVVINLI